MKHSQYSQSRSLLNFRIRAVYRTWVSIPLLVLVLGAWAYSLPSSPRITVLEKAVSGGDVAAVEAFWTEISKTGGTPLIECLPKIAPDCLTTFLWRGGPTTKNVVIRSDAMPGKPSKHQLQHLPGTDVWYRTYRFRNDARFMYMLSINDPLTPWNIEGPERAKRFAGVRTDPLNGQVIRDPRNNSYVSLPRAPSDEGIYERAGIPRGIINRHRLASAALSGTREFEVYTTPEVPAADSDAPVLILFDGEEAKVLSRVTTILDNLFSEKRIPPMIAVLLSQPPDTRFADLGCNEATSKYVANEVLPFIRKEYKIQATAAHTILGGASLGGLQATFTAIEHPDAIGNVLSQSGSFWWGKNDKQRQWLTSHVKSRPGANVKFYLDVGLMETMGGANSQIRTNRRLRDTLRSKRYNVVYREFNGTHSYPCWRAAFAEALQSLISSSNTVRTLSS